MKTIILSVTIAMAVLLSGNLIVAQDIEDPVIPEEPVVPEEPVAPEDPVIPEDPVVPEEPVPDETEVPEPDDPEELTDAPTLNAAQTRKAEKLSEASGVPVEDILRLRSGAGIEQPDTDDQDAPEDAEPELRTDAPKGRGWGVIARWLGLHPGTLGNGNGDKFMPEPEEEVDDEELPGLPDVTPEADRAVTKARVRTRAGKPKKERKELKLAEKTAHKKDQVSRGKDKSRDAAERRNSAEKAKREKPDRPAKPEKPDKPGKK